MINRTHVRKAWLYAGASAFAITAAGPIAAFAQDAEDAVQVAQAEDEDEALMEQMVVTGSRIRRSSFDTVQPIINVDKDLLDVRGFTNIADALSEIPAFGGADASAFGNQNGSSVGQEFQDFFGLGSQRTLTLVNGRRFVSSNQPTIFGAPGGIQVDFNVIPIALVERVDVVAGVGAPTYGSDAIAGTINVILRDDYEGFELSGQYGQTEDGDAENYQIQTVFGTNFADGRGNVTIAVEYNTQDGLRLTDRPELSLNDPFFTETANPALGAIDVDGDGVVDSVNVLNRNQIVQLFTEGGVVSPTATFLPSLGIGQVGGQFLQFDTNGNLVPFTAGEQAPGSAFFAVGGDGTDLFDITGTIQTPRDRVIFSGVSTFDINDYVTAFAEFTYANTYAEEFANQAGFQTFAFGGDSAALTIPVTNPFLTDQARGVLTDAGLQTFGFNRLLNDLLDEGINTLTSNVFRFAGGFEGDFQFYGREFNWEASGVYGESDISSTTVSIINPRYFNAIDAVEVTEADLQGIIDAGLATDFASAEAAILDFSGTESAGVGDIVCRGTIEAAQGNTNNPGAFGVTQEDDPDLVGCVPLNLFGLNNFSPEAQAFVTQEAVSGSGLEQRVFNLNFGGQLFELPAGWISFNIGYETRRERAAFNPAPVIALSLTRSAAAQPTSGFFSTDEFFGEAFVPLISPDMNIPGVHFLEVEGVVRRIDNSVSGNSTIFTAGGRWAPVEDVTFRGNYTQSVRSPSLVELFTPQVTSFSFANDPCDDRFIDEGPAPELRRENCEAIGLGDGFTSNIVNATAVGVTGGNPDLIDEEATTFTVGVVVQPRWVEGLQISADYVDITIDDRIASVTLTQILEACFDNANFPNVDECSAFERDADGQIVDFQTGQANAAFSEFSGVQMNLRYQKGVNEIYDVLPFVPDVSADLGDFSISANIFRTIKNDFSVAGEEPNIIVGGFGTPKWEGLFDLQWTRGAARVFWRIDYQDSSLLDPQGDNVFIDLNNNVVTETSFRLIHNLTLSYDFADLLPGGVLKTAIGQITINNLFDRRANLLQRAAADFGPAEEFGRSLLFTVRTRF